MTGRLKEKTKTTRRLPLALLAAVLAAVALACGPTAYEIAIETPIQPKLDVSPFQRVLIAGFVAATRVSMPTSKRFGCCAASSAPNRPSG